jgi:hypothetical protein
MSVKKGIIVTAIGSAIIGLGVWINRLRRTSVNLEFVPSLMLHKIDFSGVYIRVDVLVKNPSNMDLKFNYPFVKLNYEGSSVGSSQSKNEEIQIKAYSESRIEKLMIHIPLLNLFSNTGKLIASIKAKSPIILDTEIISNVNLGFRSIPFKTSFKLNLKP